MCSMFGEPTANTHDLVQVMLALGGAALGRAEAALESVYVLLNNEMGMAGEAPHRQASSIIIEF